MILPILAVLQLAIPSGPPADARKTVDLPPPWRPSSCPASEAGSDIVVCGKRDAADKDRLRPLPERYAGVGGPGIGVDLGKGVRGNLYTTPGRLNAKRVMMTVTIPF
ncbi:hypothetical protein [Sphingomonas sp. CARO-RG-8B-R24-01]|uniref:hypothetical protein n=1 Tax=Sphingomonas sp. CARO-RG-8B-R24-01 TaxID=2914831 RepID=UPI001F580765|nr:hypothetical protein [Sphingomonas sp. CARO-RG-8B-R24-01]